MKKISFLLLVAVPLMVLGQTGDASKKFEHTVQLADSPENAWNALIDFSNFKQWDSMVVDVKCPDVLKKRAHCQAIVSAGKLYDVEIDDYVENASYTLRYKLSSGNVYIKRELVPGDQLAYTETVWYKGLSKKTFEKYKGANYSDAVKTRVLNFKEYLDRSSKGK